MKSCKKYTKQKQILDPGRLSFYSSVNKYIFSTFSRILVRTDEKCRKIYRFFLVLTKRTLDQITELLKDC